LEFNLNGDECLESHSTLSELFGLLAVTAARLAAAKPIAAKPSVLVVADDNDDIDPSPSLVGLAVLILLLLLLLNDDNCGYVLLLVVIDDDDIRFVVLLFKLDILLVCIYVDQN
jgi:hypothetical protein